MIKIVRCNECEWVFDTRQKDDSKIRCPQCKNNTSLSIREYENEPKDLKEEKLRLLFEE